MPPTHHGPLGVQVTSFVKKQLARMHFTPKILHFTHQNPAVFGCLEHVPPCLVPHGTIICKATGGMPYVYNDTVNYIDARWSDAPWQPSANSPGEGTVRYWLVSPPSSLPSSPSFPAAFSTAC
jgi:hypothetical protein